jgi:hypothetical protein
MERLHPGHRLGFVLRVHREGLCLFLLRRLFRGTALWFGILGIPISPVNTEVIPGP